MTPTELQDKMVRLMCRYGDLRLGAQRLRNASELLAREADVMYNLASEARKELDELQTKCAHTDQQGRTHCNFCNKTLAPSTLII